MAINFTEFDPALLLLPTIFVFLGALFQTATGAGLGLMAIPALLFVVAGPTAAQVAILLSILLTLLVLPFEWRNADWRITLTLTAIAALATPIGLIVLNVSPTPVLKVICGIAIMVACYQLVRRVPPSKRGSNKAILPGGAVISGVMSGALGMPGPAAVWALLNTELSVTAVRASLRVFFAFIFLISMALHLFANGLAEQTLSLTVALLPALFVGVGAGLYLASRADEKRLRQALIWLLVLMGVGSFAGGVMDLGPLILG